MKKKFVIFVLAVVTALACVFGISGCKVHSPSLKATTLGIGGGGAVFTPKISPFNANEMAVTVDMGGVYISHNAGAKWDRKNLNGQVLTAYFDPNRENVVYAGGSGLYKSTDNGDNFELFFPHKDDLKASLNKEENNMRYLYSRSGIYPTDKVVKDVLVNPENSDNLFILMFSGGGSEPYGEIFETRDNGKTFEKIISYSKEKRYSTNILYELNKLLYKKESNSLYFATSEGVYKFDSAAKTAEKIYSSQEGIVDIVTVIENGQTQFIVVENCSSIPGCKTRVFHTRDFADIQDITQEIIAGLPRTVTNGDKQTEYNWSFSYLDATSIENIYLSQASYAEDRSVYGYGIEGILHYDGEGGEWLYGNNPAIDGNSKNQMSLKNRGWSDGNYKSYGIAVSKQQGCENTVLYSTITGVYYTPNGRDFYQRYCDVTKSGDTSYYSTTGLDEQTTYGVRVNPFNKDNVLLLNTDLGLIRSEDGGATWSRVLTGIKPAWTNTVYDAEFDKRKEDVVYSVWSGRHDMPYAPGNETGRAGGFAISYNGGKMWDSNYSTGLPATSVPVKMSVVYPQNSEEATIYVATMNHGFFVSYDSGKTFTEINEGLERVSYNQIFAEDIEAKGGRVFGCTAKSTFNNQVQAGEVFELINNRWEKIQLPDGVNNPRDIYFSGGTLYISCTTNSKYISSTEFYNYAGGVYAYKDGQTSLIFDGAISVAGVQINSKGVMYLSDINGNIYRKTAGGDFVKIYDLYHSISKGVQLENDDVLYLPTLGGGLLKLEGLESLR